MELPLYRIVIDAENPEVGMLAVSLVENPAIEIPFLCFEAEHQMFKVDNDRHIITGPAILADTPIYRCSPHRGEYNVVFEKETIRQLVEKYSKDGLLNSVNLQHNELSFVNSAIMIESMIIDKERGICPNEFSNLPDGSWIVSYKITDESLWNEIKNGNKLNGFSIEILSEIELIKNNIVVNDANREINRQNKMNKLFKMAKAILKLAEIATDKETLIVEGELEVGKPVFVETEEGPVEAADGEYTVEDGTVIVVEAGVITEIRPVEMVPEEEKPVEEMEEEAPEAPENEPDPRIAELEAEIEALKKEIEEKDAKIAELEGTVAEQEEKLKMSAETPLKKQIKTINKENKALKYFV